MADVHQRSSLKNRIALVTGAASGIGRASAIAFSDCGASVVLVDVDEPGLAETARHASGAGSVMVVPADVTVSADVERMVHETVRRFGRLDIAHNNAGVAGPFIPLHDYDEAAFRRVLDVDLIAVWQCMKHEIAQMRRQGSGVIINTSSMLGLTGMRDNAAYTAAKHAVHGLTRCAAIECADAGIRVNAVAPGVTRSGMTSTISDELLRSVPLGRIAEPSEIAGVVVWLASDAASYVTGSIVVADGGYLA